MNNAITFWDSEFVGDIPITFFEGNILVLKIQICNFFIFSKLFITIELSNLAKLTSNFFSFPIVLVLKQQNYFQRFLSFK